MCNKTPFSHLRNSPQVTLEHTLPSPAAATSGREGGAAPILHSNAHTAPRACGGHRASSLFRFSCSHLLPNLRLVTRNIVWDILPSSKQINKKALFNDWSLEEFTVTNSNWTPKKTIVKVLLWRLLRTLVLETLCASSASPSPASPGIKSSFDDQQLYNTSLLQLVSSHTRKSTRRNLSLSRKKKTKIKTNQETNSLKGRCNFKFFLSSLKDFNISVYFRTETKYILQALLIHQWKGMALTRQWCNQN